MKVFLILALIILCEAVDRTKFRTCQLTGFCRRYRGKSISTLGPYRIDGTSVKVDGQTITAKIIGGSESPMLNLVIAAYNQETFRVKIHEDKERWQPPGILQTLEPTKLELLNSGDSRIPSQKRSFVSSSRLAVALPNGAEHSVLVVDFDPLKIELYVGDILQISANDRSLMHYEWQRSRGGDTSQRVLTESEDDRHGGKEVVDYGEDGLAIYADGSREEKKENVENSHENSDNIARDEDWEEVQLLHYEPSYGNNALLTLY